MTKPADEDQRVTSIKGAFVIPYSVAAPIIALLMATIGFTFRNDARITTLETIQASPTKFDAQFAALTQKLTDFEEMYERDRVNDRVVQAREAKP